MPNHVAINEQFFETWSAESAWVLGILFTDGHYGKANASGIRRIYISQKETELLEKVKALMGSKHKILENTQSGKLSKIHYFTFTNKPIYESLLELGLVANKSHIIRFPAVPKEFVRHFIRGCWDGDGSFYYENNDPKRIRGDYVSGSLAFMKVFTEQLKELSGINNITIMRKHNKSNCYYIKLSPIQTVKLFSVLYETVPETMYLSKKHDKIRRSYDLLVLGVQ
jgi:LAGLIDADG-like domain